MFHHVLLNMGDLHLVLPALNLSTLNDGILIMMTPDIFVAGQEGRTIVRHSYSLSFIVGLLLHALKLWVVVAYSILVSAQGPLVFVFLVFGFWGLGFGARA